MSTSRGLFSLRGLWSACRIRVLGGSLALDESRKRDGRFTFCLGGIQTEDSPYSTRPVETPRVDSPPHLSLWKAKREREWVVPRYIPGDWKFGFGDSID